MTGNPLENSLLKDLRSILPEGSILTGEEAIICYSSDATRLPGRPDVVVRPDNTSQVAEVIRLAASHGVPVVPRGAGTGLSGGCVPASGGVVVSTERLNRIIEIDPLDRQAVVEPGVITAKLHEAVEAVGLFYPPDPASFKSSTMGGNLAENSGGLRGLKYGVTRDYAMELKVVLPSGELIKAGGRTLKNVTGYDMARLFVGSEGTLGFITEATVKLIPKPEAKAAFLAAYATLEAASEAVVAIIRAGVTPSTLEIMDDVTIKAVNEYLGREDGPGCGALILAEVDGSAPDVARQSEKLEAALGGSVPLYMRKASGAAEHESLWAARRAALSALARVSPSVILEDATVPRKRLPDMARAIRKIADKYGLLIGTFGHAGDGNLHPTIITDMRVEENRQRVDAAVADIFSAAIAIGGTLSGEHGIGLAKAAFMEQELGEAGVGAMKAVKRALDPAGIMNPGKIFL